MTDTENVRRAPPEFGEDIAQFYIPRFEETPVAHLLPVVFWVHTTPKANDSEYPHRLPGCKCERVFQVTEASYRWWCELTGWQLPASKYPGVCGCCGRLIE